MLRFVAATAAFAIVAAVAIASGRPPDSAQAGPGAPVSLDAVSDADNTATTVGPINVSRSTTCGATFNVDVVIQGVTDIAGFQADLLYNPAVLRVTAVNYNFLLTTTGTTVLNAGSPTPDADGLFRTAAAMFSSTAFTGASGNGVSARVTLQAFGTGSSVLDITSVKLADSNANPISPADANGFYLGTINDASIVVNAPCADTDGDGCPDVKEQQTAPGSQSSGGLRDYLNPWDYFEPTHNGLNRINDVAMVVSQYYKDDNDGTPGAQPYAPGYNPDTDRSSIGPNAWNLGRPTGCSEWLTFWLR